MPSPTLALLSAFSPLELVGMASGILAVFLSIQERILAWPVFIFCYGVYVFISYQAALPAAMILNAAFIPLSLYGWWKWTRTDLDSRAEIPVRRHGSPARIVSILLIGTLLLGFLLSRTTTSFLPFLDAFATLSALLAQYMLGRKYLENWTIWIISNLAFAILFGVQGYYPTVVMFCFFIGLAVWGHLQWRPKLQPSAP
ncbi:MAG: nicotinamide riboside transporter PnuC [Puniceicoccaceae bacterium]